MQKRILVSPMLAATLLTACATSNKPEPYAPQYVYLVLYGGKFHGYPFGEVDETKEVEVETKQLVGGMCLKPEDWAAREKYIMELEAFAKGK